MKNLISAVVALCLPILIWAQETKEVTEKNKYTRSTAVYDVLKSDKQIRHGSYKETDAKGQTLEEGNYKMGKKDGLWTKYSWDGKHLMTKGSYSNDEQVGEWEFYTWDGKLEQRYDFTQKKLLFAKQYEEHKGSDTLYTVYNGTDSSEMKIDLPPVLIGANYTKNQFLNKTLRYPQDAIDHEWQGTVWIAFTVHPDGTTSDYWVEHLVRGSLNAEALRVVKLMNPKWVPGMVNGKPVKMRYALPITFRLEVQ